MDILNSTQLWHSDPHVRLRAARETTAADQGTIQKWVSSNCPVAPWPYGMPTVINPKIIVLGVSPGNSPAKGRDQAEARQSYDPPTFGSPHPKMSYEDTKRFFVKIGSLCSSILRARYPLSEQDALALSGMMNLDTGEFGKASDVKLDSRLVRWVLTTINEKLRPDYLIFLGLKGRIRSILPELSPNLNARRPDRTLAFKAYARRSLRYEEWVLNRPDGSSMTVVSWPQHPSQAPFTGASYWQASIDEYLDSSFPKHGT